MLMTFCAEETPVFLLFLFYYSSLVRVKRVVSEGGAVVEPRPLWCRTASPAAHRPPTTTLYDPQFFPLSHHLFCPKQNKANSHSL